MLEPTAWGAPVAEVRQAFDEERALAEIREQLERRNDAKSEQVTAQLRTGEILLQARKAYPDVKKGSGVPKYSPGLLAFIEKAGLLRRTATAYMMFARDPSKLTRNIAQSRPLWTGRVRRSAVLTEIRDALLDSSREEVLEAINLELAGIFPNVQAKS